MTWPTLHAFMNHFPIVLAVVGAIAVLLSAMIQRRAIWMYALSTLTLAGLTVYPASWTGHRASGVVHKAWYIAPGAIHSHSQAADITVWVVGITGVLALISLITLIRLPDLQAPARGFRILVGLGALASICAVSYTGYLGGKIVVDSPALANPAAPVLFAPPQVSDTGAHLTVPVAPSANQPTALPGQPVTPAQTQQQVQPQTPPQPQPQTQPQTQPPPTVQKPHTL
ncbi:MAG: hypothetical protein ABI035_13000 [Gemmatimonadaceae bacterium]